MTALQSNPDLRNTGHNMYAVVNLDRSIKSAFYKVKESGPWIDGYEFKINEHEFWLKYNSNSINDPYILFNKELYFVITMNPSMEKIDSVRFGKFDLSEVLK